MQIGQLVRITKEGAFKGQVATVTKINGPKTVEVRTLMGVSLWSVKIANLEPVSA
jgi:hypothetical protein